MLTIVSKNKTPEGERKKNNPVHNGLVFTSQCRQQAIESPLALTDESVVPVSAVVTHTATFVFCITLWISSAHLRHQVKKKNEKQYCALSTLALALQLVLQKMHILCRKVTISSSNVCNSIMMAITSFFCEKLPTSHNKCYLLLTFDAVFRKLIVTAIVQWRGHAFVDTRGWALGATSTEGMWVACCSQWSMLSHKTMYPSAWMPIITAFRAARSSRVTRAYTRHV